MSHAAVRAHFTTSQELINEVDRLVGPRRRSEFLNEAAKEKIERAKLLKTTRSMLSLPPVDEPEWSTPEAVAKWLHELRAESDRVHNV